MVDVRMKYLKIEIVFQQKYKWKSDLYRLFFWFKKREEKLRNYIVIWFNYLIRMIEFLNHLKRMWRKLINTLFEWIRLVSDQWGDVIQIRNFLNKMKFRVIRHHMIHISRVFKSFCHQYQISEFHDDNRTVAPNLFVFEYVLVE